MNRRYALPVAIALTLHAVLFLGSGKPPTVEPTAKKPSKPADDQLVQVLIKEDPVDVIDESEEVRSTTIDLPDVPEPPIFTRVDTGITQERPKIDPHHRKDPSTIKLDGPMTAEKAPLTLDQLDEIPQPRYQKTPVYPTALRNDKIAGTVVVDFWVDENGRVHDVRVVRSTHRSFEEPTLSAVSQWRFEPGKRKGLPVRFKMSVPVKYSLVD